MQNNDSLLNLPKMELGNMNNQNWLAGINNEWQGLVGFGSCLAQGLVGMAQVFGQADIMCAKIRAESDIAVAKIESDTKIKTTQMESETTRFSSAMPLIQEEIKRLGARIERASQIILDKYSANDLSNTQRAERESLEKMIERDHAQLNELLHHVMSKSTETINPGQP